MEGDVGHLGDCLNPGKSLCKLSFERRKPFGSLLRQRNCPISACRLVAVNGTSHRLTVARVTLIYFNSVGKRIKFKQWQK